MNEKGVTLMELLVVVAIVAVISSIVMMSTGDLRQTYAVKAAARTIFGDMQRARLAAIREGREHYLCFSPAETFTSYELHRKGINITACDADDIVLKTNVISSEYRGMTFAESFSGSSATFNPNGKSSSGNVMITGGASTKTIIINGNTGNVRIQ